VKGSRPSNNIQHITSDHDVEKLSHRIGRLRVILGPDSHRLGSKQLFRSSLLDGERVVECITNLHGSRNINLGAHSNIKRLQFTGFCEDKVSDISEDRGRIGGAALQPILKSSIEKIYCNLELSIQAFGFLSKTTFQSRLSDNDEEQQALVNKINTMLSHLKTKCLVFLNEVFGQVRLEFSGLRQKYLWDLTAKTLDLAVVFYSRANVEQPYYSPSPLTDEAVISLWVEPQMVFGACFTISIVLTECFSRVWCGCSAP
jgi:hypothetical protein